MNRHLQCHLSVLNRITINLGSNEVEQNKEVLQIYASVPLLAYKTIIPASS